MTRSGLYPRRWFSRLAALAGVRTAPLAIAACLLGTACAEPPRRDCSREIWAQPETVGAELRVVGSWDGWLLPGRPLEKTVGDEGWQRLTIDDLPPGEYGYLILEDGVGRIDALNPLTQFWPEEADLEVSRLEIEDCSSPAIEVEAVELDGDGEMKVRARFLAAEDGDAIDPGDLQVRLDGEPQGGVASSVDPATGVIELAASGLGRGRHSFELDWAGEDGRGTAGAKALGWVQPEAETWEGGTLYHVLVDRYRGDGGAFLQPPPDPGARAGGTLDGIRASVEDGTLDRLGVSALWLSPVYLGPQEARLGRDDDHLYENYHGYWVSDSRAVEPAFGGAPALHALVASAHARGIRVLLDIVPNHIYEDHPWLSQLESMGGINRRDPLCVCGAADCSWGDFINTCWFTDYLPDLRLKDAAVMAQVVADAVWWVETFALDGVRLDAVPMMPRAATRRIAAGIRASAAPRDAYFLLGEVFTGVGGTEAIRYYLGPDGINSVFDFPLMWTLRNVIAHRSEGFEAVEAMLEQTEAAIEGSGAVLGRMIGNHDTSRYMSEIIGDADSDAWTDPPPQPVDPAAYERQGIALGLTLTLPGLAVLYYGDEIGLAGGDDPDCRRVMPADAALIAAQSTLRMQTERLGRLRRCLPALSGGTRTTLLADGDLYVFARDVGDGEPVVVVVNRGDTSAAPVLDLSVVPGADGALVDVVRGEVISPSAGAKAIDLAPRSIRALIPATSACADDDEPAAP